MNDGEQDSGKSVWQSKLSAAVPEFVPRIARIKVTSSGDLVINSNLSPLVPEFHPSVYFTPSGSSTPRPVHGLQQPSKQTCLKTNKTDLHQNSSLEAYQTSFPPSTKHIPVKAESSGTEKRKDGSYEGHAVVASGTSESSTGNSVKVKKKKKQRKKNESSGLISKQENTGTHASRDTITGDQLHSDTSLNDDNSVRSKAKEVSSSSQQNGILLLSHHENSSANTDSTLTANFGCCNTVNQPSSLKELYVVSTLTMSYSDKVKSSSPKSNSTSNHLGAEKTRTNHFTPEGFKRKDKPVDLKKRSEFCYGQSTGTVSSNNDGKKPVKTGQRTDDSSWKTVYRDGDDNKLKDGDSSRSQSTDTKHNQRTLKQMRRNGSFKETTCDDDDNWRVRKDVDPTSVSRKTETTFKSNIKDSNTGYLEKRTCYQEEKIVDLISKGCQDLKHEKVVGHKVVDKKGIASKRRQNFHSIDSCGTELKPSSSFPVSKARSDISEDIQEHEIKPMRMSTIPDADSNSVIAEFPDLKESVKVKRLSVTAGGTMDHKDKVTSPKATAPMSYSAVLRSPPQLKVMHAWENETASKTHGGLLKVPPPQATMAEVENESSQEESNQKRKRKKKKKTKTGDTKEQTQENGSTKRTQKPIQFNLGVMLQTITKSSPDKPQQSNKKLVISTGVLPSQLSVTVSPDTKPVKASPQLKGENKIPHNTLDSTAPVVKRGKERETPARKKPSALKKIILKEREEKKKARETTEFDDADKSSDEKENITFQAEAKITVQEIQNTFEDDAFIQADPKPSSPTHQEIAAEIHSRRFREYCFQVPDKEVDGVATDLLRELVRFQDRQFHKDPVKAKAKRRFVLGLREVHKHLKLRRLKCVIISSNVERIQSSGGLDDTLGSIINLCRENKVPVVFALKRQMLGRVLLKKVPVSIVGIFNYDGAQDHFKKLIELTQKTKQAYTDKWEETREKLELQQKEISGVKTAEMDMVPNAGLAQAGIQHTTKEAAESTGDEESDANKENDSDSEKDDVIIENDFEIQDL